jgi:hypothetical protein
MNLPPIKISPAFLFSSFSVQQEQEEDQMRDSRAERGGGSGAGGTWPIVVDLDPSVLAAFGEDHAPVLVKGQESADKNAPIGDRYLHPPADHVLAHPRDVGRVVGRIAELRIPHALWVELDPASHAEPVGISQHNLAARAAHYIAPLLHCLLVFLLHILLGTHLALLLHLHLLPPLHQRTLTLLRHASISDFRLIGFVQIKNLI